MKQQRIAIIGGGPAGLTAAITGYKLGLDVSLFEQAPDFQQIGGGLLIHSNGQRVLDALGLLESFRPQMRFSRLIGAEKAGGAFIAATDYAEMSNRLPAIYCQAAVVLRYHLQEHLLTAVRQAAIPIHFGYQATKLQLKGEKACLYFENGDHQEFDIIIAADGVHSPLREAAAVPFTRVRIGEAWLRGIVPLQTEATHLREIWGNDGRRFGIAPLTDNLTYFYARAPLHGWPEMVANGMEEWIESWRPFGSDVMAILNSVPDWRRVNYSELHEIRMPRWYQAPLFFIGDAAHAMTPNLGQGANSAMVDALVLMQLLAQAEARGDTLAQVGQQYDQIRRPFVTRTQTAARQAGAMANWTSTPALWLRDTLFALTRNIPVLGRQTLPLLTGYNPLENDFFKLTPAAIPEP